ncbi:MAG: GGDEF domain-containing protein, partial [Pseudomonadota bacterium]
MACKWVSALLVMLTAAVALSLPAPAFAKTSNTLEAAPMCHAASDDTRTFADMCEKAAWTCGQTGWAAHTPVAWLRFEKDTWRSHERPYHFFSRIARHRAISLATLDKDGTMRVAKYDEADTRPFARGPVFQLPLPEITQDTEAVLVRIERPHSVPLLTEARLTNNLKQASWSQVEVMLLAFILGMLVLPLLFDISFFVVLRERFVVLHALMVVSMMTYVLFAGGLITVFADLS